MAVEPESYCWVTGREVARRDGQTWLEEFRRFPALEYVVRDAGVGLSKAVELLRQQRPSVRDGLDVFHRCREGGKALQKAYGRASRAMEAASKAQKKLDRLRWRGKSLQGRATAVARQWREAERLLDEAAAAEVAWKRVRSALELFTPEGKLQDRCHAEASVAEELPKLAGAEWAKTCRLLERPETFAFLDRAHEQLAQLGLPQDTLEALLSLEGLRRRPRLLQGEGPSWAAARGLAIARTIQLEKTDPNWRELAKKVRDRLRRAWRASSLVEGINSVARMQQARHRRMTQGLLDLKRLYWNLRPFRTGRRRHRSPYQLLGLNLPSGNWWHLLKLSPDQLRQLLSGETLAA